MDMLKSSRAKRKTAKVDASVSRRGPRKKKDVVTDKSIASRKKKSNNNVKEKSERKKKTTGKDLFDVGAFTFKVDQTFSLELTKPSGQPRSSYESFAKGILSQGVDGLMKEYQSQVQAFIPVGHYARVIFDMHTASKKNRYKDVVCNDFTRVILRDGRDGDYIHANYVRGLKPLYILAQGPTKESIIDFWRMIVQEEVSAIAMLCEFSENGKQKCEMYFSVYTGSQFTFGDFTIVTESISHLDEHMTCAILVATDSKNGKRVRLTHYKISTWPDKTVAKSNAALFRTYNLLRTHGGTIMVHCSAGIGRTGTFVAIDIAIQLLLNEKSIKLPDVVKFLRHCRLSAVQMDTQYLMLAEAVVELGLMSGYYSDQKTIEGIEAFKKEVADYVVAHPPPPEKVAAPATTIACGVPTQSPVPSPNIPTPSQMPMSIAAKTMTPSPMTPNVGSRERPQGQVLTPVSPATTPPPYTPQQQSSPTPQRTQHSPLNVAPQQSPAVPQLSPQPVTPLSRGMSRERAASKEDLKSQVQKSSMGLSKMPTKKEKKMLDSQWL